MIAIGVIRGVVASISPGSLQPRGPDVAPIPGPNVRGQALWDAAHDKRLR